MEKSKLNSLVTRAVSSFILAPLVLGAIYYGWSSTALLSVLAIALLSWEWAQMIPNEKNTVYALSYMIAAVCAVFFANILWSIAIFFCMTLFVWLKAKGEKHRRLLTLGVPYIALGIGALVWLYIIFGTIITLWFVVAVWSVDIGGYVVGCTLKGPKLAPKISPNKTWAGLFGAMLFSALTSVAVAYFFARGEYAVFATLGVVLALIAQAGDLLESMVKRYLKVKDSSNLIPGHGGIFDRLDGLLFAAPFMLVIFIFFIF